MALPHELLPVVSLAEYIFQLESSGFSRPGGGWGLCTLRRAWAARQLRFCLEHFVCKRADQIPINTQTGCIAQTLGQLGERLPEDRLPLIIKGLFHIEFYNRSQRQLEVLGFLRNCHVYRGRSEKLLLACYPLKEKTKLEYSQTIHRA